MFAHLTSAFLLCALAGSALPVALAQPAAPGYTEPTAYVPLSFQRSPEGFKTPDNAALLYYQALLKLDREKVNTIKPDQAGADWLPDEPARAILKDQAYVVGGLIRASQIDACDWGYEYGLGWSLELPHFGALRSAVRLLDADARRLIADKAPPEQTAARLAAMLRMSDHASREPVLIGALVGAAILALSADTVDFALSRQALDGPGRDTVLIAARSLLNSDPLNYKAALRNEQRVTLASVQAMQSGRDPNLAAGLHAMFAGLDEGGKAGALEGAQLQRAITQLNACYDELLSAWDAPPDEAVARFKAVNEAVDKGAYGLYAKLLLPAITKAYESQQRTRARLEKLIKSLEDYTPPAAPAGAAPGR